MREIEVCDFDGVKTKQINFIVNLKVKLFQNILKMYYFIIFIIIITYKMILQTIVILKSLVCLISYNDVFMSSIKSTNLSLSKTFDHVYEYKTVYFLSLYILLYRQTYSV